MPFTQAHDDEELLREVGRVVARIQSGPVTQRHFKELSSMVSPATLLRRSAHWQDVLARAGHPDRYGGRVVSAKMRAQRSRTLTDTEIIAELRRGCRGGRHRHARFWMTFAATPRPSGRRRCLSASAHSRPHLQLLDCAMFLMPTGGRRRITL